MANYPDHEILLGSSVEEESGVGDDFAQSGSQHSRLFHSQSYYRFLLYHQMSVAEFKTFHATYVADRRADYTLTYHAESPIATYTVRFIGAPQQVQNLGLGRVMVEAPLRGYRNA